MSTRRKFLQTLSFCPATLTACGGATTSAEVDLSETPPAGFVQAGPGPIPAPTSEPAPAPTPTPAPAPAPAPATPGDARIGIQVVNSSRLVEFTSFHKDSRYERFQRLQVLTGATAKLRIQAYNLAASFNTFNSALYTLLIDGKVAAQVTVPAGSKEAEFEVNLSSVPAGWRRLDLSGLSGGETCPSWWVFVKKGSVGLQAFTPIVQGTYELAQSGGTTHMWALAPGEYRPTSRPLSPRNYAPFATAVPRSELHCAQLVPMRFGDVHRPNRNVDGILSSYDFQPYTWTGFIASKPNVALLDGPRGVGTVCMLTHVSVGTAAPPNTGPRNNVYFCDSWRVGKVGPDGKVTTLAGYRHIGVLSHWEDPASVELVGDWSAVPAERRGFHELWGMAWDERTLVINESAAPIASEENQQPHTVGPVMFLADSQRNRICRLEFSAVAHGVPPRVTEFITNIADPWDVAYASGVIYVTERQSHRIAAYNATTGALEGVVVQGQPLARIDSYREVVRLGTMAQLREASCVAPEGLYLQDGWLYWGSKAQAQVRRVPLKGGPVEVVCEVPMDGNSKFVKIALSDGTFGPRNAVFTWTWSNAQYGMPATTLPGGTRWAWESQQGGAGNFAHFVYATAGSVGQGKLVTGGVNEGLLVISRKQAGDQAPSAAAVRGEREYSTRGLHLLHGHNGFGFYGLPLPWGVSSDIAAFLESHGHTRN